MARPSHRLVAAVAELAGRDPVVAELAAAHGVPPLATRPAAGRFEALVRSIVFQQLAGRAALAIWGRVRAALGDEVTPARLLATPPDRLAEAGLSGAKRAAVYDLAGQVAAGTVRLERIGRLGDEEVVEHLVKVRGIGRWTAEMFLLFTLGRTDVWPVGDFGVRAGYARAWGLASHPTPAQLAELGEPFRPYRSLVAWYCWRAADSRAAPVPRPD